MRGRVAKHREGAPAGPMFRPSRGEVFPPLSKGGKAERGEEGVRPHPPLSKGGKIAACPATFLMTALTLILPATLTAQQPREPATVGMPVLIKQLVLPGTEI